MRGGTGGKWATTGVEYEAKETKLLSAALDWADWGLLRRPERADDGLLGVAAVTERSMSQPAPVSQQAPAPLDWADCGLLRRPDCADKGLLDDRALPLQPEFSQRAEAILAERAVSCAAAE